MPNGPKTLIRHAEWVFAFGARTEDVKPQRPLSGAQMANLAGLAAARHHVLAGAGWDVEADGLAGAPPVTVLVGAERHATIGRSLRFLGFGESGVAVVPADAQGRMDAQALRRALEETDGPSIVCAQAGNVNTRCTPPSAC